MSLIEGVQGVAMSDFHRNIFSYFRGASQPEQDRQRQLEDNTTKALVNTLEHSDRHVVITFLEWLGISTSGTTRFAQQKVSLGDELVRRKRQRLLLAIVGSKNSANQALCDRLPVESDGTSRPDAWLHGEDFAVLIESKVEASTLDLNQMACHWHKLHPQKCKVVTWAEVHRFFKELAGSLGDTKTQWIVKQFTDYLEWTGMTEFAGFREEMFKFFVASERDSDTQRWVRGAVEGLADVVLEGNDGLRDFDKWYSDKHVGNLAKDADHYWVAFGPAKDFRNWAHQTISLYEQKLDIFVNVELFPAIKKLRRKIEGGDFRKVVSKLPAPFTIHIEERRMTTQPRVFDYFPVADVEGGTQGRRSYGLKDARSPGFDYVERLLFDIEYPYISVRKSIDRRQVLELSMPNGDALVTEVLKILKGFHPLVEYING